jgi:hypothetical protein
MVACDHMGPTKVCNGWAIGTKFNGIARGPRPSLLWGFNKPLLGHIFATHVKNHMTLKVLKCWTLYPIYYVVLCTSRLHPGTLFINPSKPIFFHPSKLHLLSWNKIVGSFVTCDVWPDNVDRNALKIWRENSDIHFMHKKATLIPHIGWSSNAKQYKGPCMVRMSILEC